MSARDPSRYYVYRLVDPRDGQTFYIGKGCKNRAWQHTKDVKRGVRCNGKKQLRIHDILASGLEPEVKIVRERMGEDEALLLERQLIAEERETLTNAQPGQNTFAEQYVLLAKQGIKHFGTMIVLEEKGYLVWEPGWTDACWSMLRLYKGILEKYGQENYWQKAA